MNRYRILIVFSMMISLIMCALISSSTFFSLHTFDSSLYKIVLDIFNFKVMTPINIIFAAVFFLNTISLVTFLLKNNTKLVFRKHLCYLSALILLFGLILYSLIVVSYMKFYFFDVSLRDYSLISMFTRWTSRFVIFYISSLYLIIVQFYIIKKYFGKSHSNLFVLYAYFIIITFLTLFTFARIDGYLECLLEIYFELKIGAIANAAKTGMQSKANIGSYLCYLLFITLIFGTIIFINKKKNFKKINE